MSRGGELSVRENSDWALSQVEESYANSYIDVLTPFHTASLEPIGELKGELIKARLLAIPFFRASKSTLRSHTHHPEFLEFFITGICGHLSTS